MATTYILRRMEPRQLARSLGGALARAKDGMVLLQIETRAGIKVPACLEDGTSDSANYSYIEGYYTRIDEEGRICMEVAARDRKSAYEVCIMQQCMDMCIVDF